MPEYPTLRLNRQSLLNRFQQVVAKGLDQIAGYEVVSLARTAYYLRDPQAATYLRQAAQTQSTTMNQQIASLSYYRMAGDQAAMHECFQKLPTKPVNAGQWEQKTYHWGYFQALFWLGDDRECIKRYQQQTSLQAMPLASLISQLAEARLTSNSQQALTVAQRLAMAIREERLEPWSNSPLNLWDLYELSCQLLNPPLSIDAALLETSTKPAQRLLTLLQAQQIVALEWSIYNNNDEADEGFCIYHVAHGSSAPFNQGIANQELERLVWDVVNYDWYNEFSDQQPYGVYRLDVHQAQVSYLGMLWSSYEYEDLRDYAKSEPSVIPHPVIQHPVNQDLYVMYLPEALRQAVDLTRWNGEQRSY